MAIALGFLAALVCLSVAAVFAAAESAFATVSRSDIDDAHEEGRRGAVRLQRVVADPLVHTYVLTFLRQFTEALATVFIAYAYLQVFDVGWEAVVCTVVTASVAVFVVAGVSPRNVARHYPLQTALLLGGLVSGLRTALGPVALVLVWLGNMLTPARVSGGGAPLSESQLLDYVDRAQASDVIEDEERTMIANVISLGDTRAWKIMVPRTDLVTVSTGTTLDDAMVLFLRSGFSRVPVTGEDVDDVRGFLYLKDIARQLHMRPELSTEVVDGFAREARFVPDTKQVDDLLQEMQARNTHAAVVVDEYGGTAGIVTIEDIVEEIVGEIDDEYDVSDEAVWQEDGSAIVSARMDIDDLAELFDVKIEDEDVSSVGGLLQKLVGRVPIAGAHARISGLRLEALPGEGRRHRITRVRVDGARDRTTQEA
ncbi:MAG TPA: hemolysin family protein [Brevibacterium senegalense]|uniref:Hemolysin family protein n=1 Tax=Brevibacterium senegalense TaxID=1033736 RepID=A0A921MBT6_9MICO|nr:hemolysin family protein [Brevibacterium senegalense]HLR44410.1 hemolysin family protein [Brevibacterium sp.]